MDIEYTEEQKKPVVIMKYCVYNFVDKLAKSYMGLITNAIHIFTEDGKKVQKCVLPEGIREYEKIGSFYGINPMLKPMPMGMIMIEMKMNREFPYNTISIRKINDPYKLDDDSIYMMVWGTSVPNTIPLYFYENKKEEENKDIIHITFRESPPAEKWSEHYLSPIYVLSSDLKDFKSGDEGNKYLFKNYHGRCIPSSDGISLQECIVKTDLIVNSPLEGIRPSTLLEHIRHENIEGEKVDKVGAKYFFRKMKPFYMGLVLLVFSLSLIISVLVLYKSINKSII